MKQLFLFLFFAAMARSLAVLGRIKIQWSQLYQHKSQLGVET